MILYDMEELQYIYVKYYNNMYNIYILFDFLVTNSIYIIS